MESVHILQYVVLTKSGIFWSTVEIHILCSCGSRGWADLPAVQSLRRGAWQEDTAGGDAIRLIDWIVSAPLLFSDQCPTIYHFLSACLFLLPLTPTSVLPHTSYCPLFTVFCRVLSQAALSVPHPLPLSVSFHCWPFITQDLLKAYSRNLNGLLDS